MSISSGDGDIGTGQQDIPCRYEGDGVTIALNYHYLEEPFKVMKSDEVEVLFNDTGKALTIRPLPESDFFHVVMPMQQD
jgi:DNA polymerase-3 subunit beta